MAFVLYNALIKAQSPCARARARQGERGSRGYETDFCIKRISNAIKSRGNLRANATQWCNAVPRYRKLTTAFLFMITVGY